jgi:hypothetical protein
MFALALALALARVGLARIRNIQPCARVPRAATSVNEPSCPRSHSPAEHDEYVIQELRNRSEAFSQRVMAVVAIFVQANALREFGLN